jgi:Mn2+/Fe2+ NRAMP family transporter
MQRGAHGVRRTVARRRRLLMLLAVLGPGMITANAGNDAGGIATFASVGAEFGYSHHWILIPIANRLGIVQ